MPDEGKLSEPGERALATDAALHGHDLSGAADHLVRAQNEELLRRTGQHLELVVTVLTEQRDAALRQLASAEARSEQQRAGLMEEQERFITFLMEDHEVKLDALTRELASNRQDLERRRALGTEAISQRSTVERSSTAPVEPDPGNAALVDQIESLKQLLESAQAEVEDTRADAVRLQEERDEAIRATDDLRVELVSEVDSAHDETFQLQTQLDDAYRQLEDARDEARDEAYRASEEKSELQRDLDERTDEVRRLRARLAELSTEAKPSQPPPPAALKQLEDARQENQLLRKQLIDAKRELSRASREAGLSRTGRGRRSGALALRTGAGEGQPGTVPIGRMQGTAKGSTNESSAGSAKPSHAGPAELRPVAKPSSGPPAAQTVSPSATTEPTKPT